MTITSAGSAPTAPVAPSRTEGTAATAPVDPPVASTPARAPVGLPPTSSFETGGPAARGTVLVPPQTSVERPPALPTNPGPLKRLAAGVGELAQAPIGLVSPPGTALIRGTYRNEHQTPFPGQEPAVLTYEQQTLTFKDPTGKAVTLEAPNEEGFKMLVDIASGMASPGQRDRSTSTVDGFGWAGSLVSVKSDTGSALSGMPPTSSSSLTTYDTRTGERVGLKALLSPEQFKGIVDTIEAEAPKLIATGQEGALRWSNREELEAWVDGNFGLQTQADGGVQITVSASDVVADGGPTKALNFTFQAPRDAKFRAAIGADKPLAGPAFPPPQKATIDALERVRYQETGLRENVLDALRADPATARLTNAQVDTLLSQLGSRSKVEFLLQGLLGA